MTKIWYDHTDGEDKCVSLTKEQSYSIESLYCFFLLGNLCLEYQILV